MTITYKIIVLASLYLAKSNKRAIAISISMVSTTLGAVAGPNLVEPMGRFATSLGVPALAGPFILAAAAYIIAGLVLLAFLHPDPLLVAKAIASMQRTDGVNLPEKSSSTLAKQQRGIVVGATI